MSFAKQRQSSCYRIERDEARAEVIDLRARIRELEADSRALGDSAKEVVRVVAERDAALAKVRELETSESRLREALERIAKNHYECEDGFYSCPAHPEYFGDDDSRECNCWAGVARAALEVKP